MSAYFIFIIVLTVVYVLYYSIVIVQDLYGKKGEATTSEEVIDVSSMDGDNESVAVVESDKGFSIGDNDYETHVDMVREEPELTELSEEDSASRLKYALANMEANMEHTDVTMSHPADAETVRMAIAAGGKLSKNAEMEWTPIIKEV